MLNLTWSVVYQMNIFHRFNQSISISRSVMSDSLQLRGLWPTRLFYPWNSSGRNTGMGYHSLLQSIFLTQGLNLHLLLYACILHYLEILKFHLGFSRKRISIVNKLRAWWEKNHTTHNENHNLSLFIIFHK